MSKLLPYLLSTILILNISDAALKPDRDEIYRTIGKVELKVDIFEPVDLKKTDSRPAIVFFFGGGWQGGTPSQFHGQARALAERGMVAFCADYRVKKRHDTTPFECVEDGKAAIAWVRKNAAKLGVDPTRIVASGGSAGGHVAACTVVINNPESASFPNAIVLFNPVLDTTKKGYGSKRFSLEQQTTLSPCHHVKRGLPPSLIFHGTGDTTVPFENAERFTNLMKKAGNRCELKPYPDHKHGFFNKHKSEESYQKTLQQTIDFLQSLNYLPQ